MGVAIKVINQELANRGHRARLVKAPGYFYFFGGEAADWLDRTVRVPTLSSLTLAQWVAEFQRLKKLNAEILRTKPKPAKVGLRNLPRVAKDAANESPATGWHASRNSTSGFPCRTREPARVLTSMS